MWAGAGHAYQEASAVKKELNDIFAEAARTPAVHIDTASNAVIPPDTTEWADGDVQTVKGKVEELQHKVAAVLADAEEANSDLAAVLRVATGGQAPDAAANPPLGAAPPQGPPNPGGGKPRTWQDMLLPTGTAGTGPGGTPPKGPPAPVSAAGKPPSLEDLMLGRGQPTRPGDQPPLPGSVPDLLSRPQKPGSPGAPPPQLNPSDVQTFKALVRPSLAAEGVPPDQIEARLDDAVVRAQQWIDNGMPNYVPPEPQRPPPPGFGEGFGDRWRETEQGIKNLIGQGGPGAPGVLESWEQMLKGTAATAINPLGAAAGEIANAVGSPNRPTIWAPKLPTPPSPYPARSSAAKEQSLKQDSRQKLSPRAAHP